LAALAALAAWVVSVVLVVLAAQVALEAQVALAAQAVLAVLAGLVVPSPRGLAARGLTTLRIEAVPPTPTSGPPTSSVVKPGGNRGSGVQEPPTGPPVTVKGRVELVQETGLPPAVRDSAAVPAGATGYPVPAAAAAVIR
jgi:hypothetical protein